MLSMFGRLIASIYLLILPSKKYNLTYFKCVVFQTISILILCSSHLFPDLASILYIVGMILFGLSRGISTFPYLLLFEHFNSPEDMVYVNIWFGIVDLGNVWGYLFVSVLLNNLSLHWTLSYLILVALYLFTGILTFLVVPETER